MDKSSTCVRHLGGEERIKRSSYANICYAQLAACQKQVDMRIDCIGPSCNSFTGRCKSSKKSSLSQSFNLCRKDTVCTSEHGERKGSIFNGINCHWWFVINY